MKKQVPVTVVLAGALVIVAVVAYMILVRPHRAESARLDEEIAALEAKLAAQRPAAGADEPKEKIEVAELFRLAKAMPDDENMAAIILEVNAVASAAGIRFDAIEPKEPVSADSYRGLPITLTFVGSYYDLTDFLFRLRNLVTVKDGTLSANGRLYTLDAIDLHESEDGFPQIEAVLTISAYVFGAADGAAPAPEAPVPTETTETETPQTETPQTETAETTTATSPDGTTSEGGTP